MLPYCEEVLVTKVRADGGAEVFYDNLDENPDFVLAETSDPLETNGYTITFNVYRNRKVRKAWL